MKHIGWLLFVLYSSNALSAGEVEIPLLAETAHLQTAISRALEFDENGQSTISNDPCNRVELSDMMVVTEDAQLSVGPPPPVPTCSVPAGGRNLGRAVLR